MSRLSIVIPALGRIDALEETLVSVLENRPFGSELIVLHPGNYNDPYHLEGEVRFLAVPPGTDLVRSLAIAAETCQSDVMHVLAAGAIVAEGWTDGILAHFADPQVASVTPIVTDHETHRPIAAGVAFTTGGGRRVCRPRVSEGEVTGVPRGIVGPVLAASFYRRTAVSAVGGFPVEMGDQVADIDLGLSLTTAGYRTVIEPACRIQAPATSPAKSSAFTCGRGAEWLYWRHAVHAGKPLSLIAHALHTGVNLLGNLPHPKVLLQLAGHVGGLLQRQSQLQHREQLRAVAAPEANPSPTGAPAGWRIDAAHQASHDRATQPVRTP